MAINKKKNMDLNYVFKNTYDKKYLISINIKI